MLHLNVVVAVFEGGGEGQLWGILNLASSTQFKFFFLENFVNAQVVNSGMLLHFSLKFKIYQIWTLLQLVNKC